MNAYRRTWLCVSVGLAVVGACAATIVLSVPASLALFGVAALLIGAVAINSAVGQDDGGTPLGRTPATRRMEVVHRGICQRVARSGGGHCSVLGRAFWRCWWSGVHRTRFAGTFDGAVSALAHPPWRSDRTRPPA